MLETPFIRLDAPTTAAAYTSHPSPTTEIPMIRTFALTALAAALSVSSAPAHAAPANADPTFVSIGDVPVAVGARRTQVLSGLEHPWSMAWLPDGTLLITERPGRLRVFRNGALDPTPVAGTPEVLAFGQGGLLDVSPHPEFAQNRWLYLSYAVGTDTENRTRVARARFDGKALSDLEVIFENAEAKPGGSHFGSRLAWLPDGTLLISVGDGGNPPIAVGGAFVRLKAQDRASHFGKIVRLNDDGSLPKDNPFAAEGGVAASIYSYGHRNIQGLAVDAETGAIWANEHGPLGGDEFNRITKGANYGWPSVSHGREYVGGAEIGTGSQAEGKTPPVLVWNNATAPSGLMVYRGSRFPEWRGQVFSGGLMTQDVRKLEIGADGRISGQTALRVGTRVRDVREGPDGAIWVLTDESNGRLFRFEPAG
jgi:glucose/arabinose dehydrogenase